MAKRQIGRKRKSPKILIKVQVYGYEGYCRGMGGVVTVYTNREIHQRQVDSLLDKIEAVAGTWVTDNSLD